MLQKPEENLTERRVNIKLVHVDMGLQMRVEKHKDTIAEYAEAMKYGAEFPPLECAELDGELLLYDGFLRHSAYCRRRATEVLIRSRVVASHDDVVLLAVGANAYQGLKRTNADKRRSVEYLLNTDKYRNLTNDDVANAAGVSDEFVRKYRAKQSKINQTLVYPTDETAAATRIDKAGRKRPTTYKKRKPKPNAAPKTNGGGPSVIHPPYQKMEWPTDEQIGKPPPELRDQPHPDHPGMTYLQVFRRDNPGYVHALPRDRKLKEDAEIATREFIGRVRELDKIYEALVPTLAKMTAEQITDTLNSMTASGLWKSKFNQLKTIERVAPIVLAYLITIRNGLEWTPQTKN